MLLLVTQIEAECLNFLAFLNVDRGGGANGIQKLASGLLTVGYAPRRLNVRRAPVQTVSTVVGVVTGCRGGGGKTRCRCKQHRAV